MAAMQQTLPGPQDRQETGSDEPTVDEVEKFRYGHTDLGNSERFIVLHGYNIRYCVELKEWFLWDGTRWKRDKLRRVHQRAKATVKTMFVELAAETDGEKRKALFKFIQQSESERSLSAMVNLARTDPRISTSVEAFDLQPHLLNCKNGTIDLRTGTLLLHRREDLITKQCPVVYDPAATSAAWESFLNDCTNGDAELKAFLQRAAGYSVYGDPREQVIFMVIGAGGTGKSTFVSVVYSILGDYAATADFSTFLKKDRLGSAASDDIASLAGARLVTSVEVDEGKQLAEAVVKQLTGGDIIRARHIYQSSFEFKPQFALWLVCNHAPVVKHDDDAMWRRIRRLPFNNVIPEDKRDQNLKSILSDPARGGPAVLAWAVKGCVEWFQHGLQVPEAVRRATEAYKTHSNPLADFVTEVCVLNATVSTTVSVLRQAYDAWCRDNGEKEPLNRNKFADAIRDLGCTPAGGVARLWTGIGLRADPANR